jgi:integrase
MLQLAKQLIDERKVAESTASAYIKTLYHLNDKKPFKNLTFLKNTEGIDKIISEYAESTQRAILAAVVSVLAPFRDKATYKRTYTHYYTQMMEKSEKARGEEGKNEKTEKQKENWLSWEEINKRKAELNEADAKLQNLKSLTNTQFDTVLQSLVLALYTDIQPRRNQDYAEMYIVKKHTDKMPTDKNYLDIATGRFIFNKYKTAKKYKTQTETVPDSLMTKVNLYLKFHPLWKGVAKRKTEPVKFLVNADGTPLTAVNAITRILNRIFGKKIGSSMLRHIYLSDKYKDVNEEMKKDAEAMGHSTAVQKEYIKKDDTA